MPSLSPGHTPRTRFARSRPFRFTKGAVDLPPHLDPGFRRNDMGLREHRAEVWG